MADNKINVGGRLHSIATGNVLGGADEILDDSKNKKQSDINAETDAALEDRYTKEQTYSKPELNNLITTPNQQYVSVTANSQTTTVTDVLPATGAANTVYRVGNWDSSQFDASVYSEYAWNGNQYVHLSTKTQIGEVFDISAYHATGGTLATYADLSAALDSNNGGGVPQSLQKGGMSIKFVQSSDNNYVQCRFLLSGSFTIAQFTNPVNWQCVDDEPIPNSKNLVESGGVDLLCNQMPLLTGVLRWFVDKCYRASDGLLITVETYYVCSDILDKSFMKFVSNAIDDLFYESNSDRTCISFWNNDEYVGYRTKSGYHNPSGTSVSNLTYDSFAINLDPNVFSDYSVRFKIDNATDISVLKGIVFPTTAKTLLWYSERCYKIEDGTWLYSANYCCTRIYEKSLYNVLLGISDILKGVYTVISFWNNGEYVGYRVKAGYKNPDGTSTDSLVFDSFAISLHPSEFASYQSLVVSYSILDAKNTSTKLDEHERVTNPLLYSGKLVWGDGYYRTNNGKKNAGNGYVCTEKYSSRYYSLLGDALIYILTNNFAIVSFWNNGEYAGYRIGSKYYNPSGTEISTISFNEFALNLRPNDFPGYDYANNIVVGLIGDKKFQFKRKFYALGDSTTYGYGSTGNNVGWANILSTLAEFDKFVKRAQNSAFCMYHEGEPRLSTQVANIPQGTTGIVTVMIGTNDFFFDSPLGDASQTLAKSYSNLNDTDNFADAFRYNIETIKRNSPDSIIICMAPLPSYDANNTHSHLDETNLFTIRDIERTICNAMGIPFVESNKEFGLSRYVADWNYFFSDFCHPNDNGYQRIAHCMLGKFIEFAQ